MRNEIVKYHNDLNTVPMRNWTKEEMDFFFAILSKMKNKGTEEVNFDKKMLVELINYNRKEINRFYRVFENLGHKVSQIYYFEKSSHTMRFMPLFNEFRVDWSEDYSDVSLTVSASPNFEYILNKFDAEFTQYELAEFTLIRSTYAKTMYRLLKQWRTIGRREFNMDNFRQLLDIPKSYGVSDIDKRVISPIKKELPDFFKNLNVEKVKARTRGTPIIAYVFTWKPEKTGQWVENKYQNYNRRSELLNQDDKQIKTSKSLSNDAKEKVKETLERIRK